MIPEENESPQNSKTARESVAVEDGRNTECIISPRFRSVAAMAGWDEESLLIASFIVEDTPEREPKEKKRGHFQFKSPKTSSRRKRRAQRRSPTSIPIAVFNLDDEETAAEKKMDSKSKVIEEKQRKEGKAALPEESSDVSHSGSSFPCMDKLREELSCAICLEICFEPSTTPCGHSFCKKCLRSAADKCGKRCPKCRQLISNGRSCTVNTVLWNTIQLLFPKEVEARKASGILNSHEAERQSPEEASRNIPVPRRIGTVVRRRETSTQVEEEEEETLGSSWRRRRRGVSSQEQSVRRGRRVPSQEEDAALAFRLQREEFMGALRGGAHHAQPRTRRSFSSAREALRAMASRATDLRIRGRPI